MGKNPEGCLGGNIFLVNTARIFSKGLKLFHLWKRVYFGGFYKYILNSKIKRNGL